MKERSLRTTVIGSYPFPSWLEFASQHLDQFGTNEIAEMQEDAVITAIHDQMAAGLDVITDGEQSRLTLTSHFMVISAEYRPSRGRCECSGRLPMTSAVNTKLSTS